MKEKSLSQQDVLQKNKMANMEVAQSSTEDFVAFDGFSPVGEKKVLRLTQRLDHMVPDEGPR